jgi:hypothetical protein
MGDCFLRMDRFENGFTVEIKDPAIVKANEKRDNSSKVYTPYKDPWKTFVFKSSAEVQAFLKKNMDKAVVSSKPASDYDGSFDVACADGD